MDSIEFRNISHCYGKTEVLHQLSFKIPFGGLTGLIGPSGCGKTTCLELMNGLLQPTSGEIYIHDSKMKYNNDSLITLRRSMGYCLQGIGLFPHLKIKDNITLVADRLKSFESSSLKVERVKELLDWVQLDYREVQNKYPSQLSGGQRQRVGLARALFLKPKILLMDEPFGALDPLVRLELQNLILKRHSLDKFTLVLVTHDMIEAFKICDDIILLKEGRIEQRDSPEKIQKNPESQFVEEYINAYQYTHSD